MTAAPVWLRLCVTKPVLRRAAFSAAIVGSVLILINYGDALLQGVVDRTRLIRMLLTIVIPFVVSTVSSVITILEAGLERILSESREKECLSKSLSIAPLGAQTANAQAFPGRAARAVRERGHRTGPEAMAFVEKVNRGMRSIPTILFPDGSTLVEPSNAELAQKSDCKPERNGRCTTPSSWAAGRPPDGGVVPGPRRPRYAGDREGRSGRPGRHHPDARQLPRLRRRHLRRRVRRPARAPGPPLWGGNPAGGGCKEITPNGPYMCAFTGDGMEYAAKLYFAGNRRALPHAGSAGRG